jgi:hypothetical protein
VVICENKKTYLYLVKAMEFSKHDERAIVAFIFRFNLMIIRTIESVRNLLLIILVRRSYTTNHSRLYFTRHLKPCKIEIENGKKIFKIVLERFGQKAA